LVKLRGELKDIGLHTQERQLICAIRRSELSRRTIGLGTKNNDVFEDQSYYSRPYVRSWAERYAGTGVGGSQAAHPHDVNVLLNAVFFDWTCQYGMSPGRPVLLVVGFGVFFTVIYTLAQCFPRWAASGSYGMKTASTKTKGDYPSRRLTGFPTILRRGHAAICDSCLAS
jgi:hypothetical protein